MDDRIRLSRKQERRGAQRFGGKVTAGSGNQNLRKGDVHTEDELIEFKGTDAMSFSLKLSELHTAGRHALLAGKRMVFGVEFWGPKARYVVLEESDYLELVEELRQWISESGKMNHHIIDLEDADSCTHQCLECD